MSCATLVPLVTDYLEHALPAEESSSLEAHFADCPHCRAHLDQLKATLSELGRLPTEAIDPVVHGELLERFHRWSQERASNGGPAS